MGRKWDLIKQIQLDMLVTGMNIEAIKSLTKNYHRLTFEELITINTMAKCMASNSYKESVTSRTQKTIDAFRGNEDEFGMLKGLLCMNHGWDNVSDNILSRNTIDTGMIAERMDELNREAREQHIKNKYGKETTHCVVSIRDKDVPVVQYRVIPITERLLNNDQECWNREVWGTEEVCNQTCADLIHMANLDGRDIWYDVVNDYTLVECEKPDDKEWFTLQKYAHHTDYYNLHDELIFAKVKRSHYLYGIITSNQTCHSML